VRLDESENDPGRDRDQNLDVQAASELTGGHATGWP
jgi:hypothetical protein